MTTLLSFTPALAEYLRASPCNYVVTGASGWLGSATLAMLRHALGEDFDARVTALGSRQAHPMKALLEWKPPDWQPLIIFHYAFLTKDKVSGLSTEEFIERNSAISQQVRSWISASNIKGVVLPSSGAVYEHLLQKSRDLAAGLYGQLKYQDEIDFTAACAAHDTSLIIARVFNLSGPYINKFDSYALASFIKQVLGGQPISIQARKPVLRSYYFIGDLVELCVQLLFSQSTAVTECFDVAGEEIIELGELAQRVVSVLADHASAPIQRMTMLDNAVEDRYIGNNQRIKELAINLGLHPMPLDQQIKTTSRYMQSVLHP
jgi:UDP-glucuronate decarboxylase